MTCSECGRLTRLQEQFMHLSLELPETADEAARLDTQSLLRDHLQVQLDTIFRLCTTDLNAADVRWTNAALC